MKEPKVLTLVLSSMKAGYKEILFEGQMPTWIGSFRDEGFQIIPYASKALEKSESISAAIGKLEARLTRQSIITRAHLNQFRRVRSHPSPSSSVLSEQLFERKVHLDFSNQMLLVDIPDSLATIGFSTLSVLKHSLENYEFDYLVRTNTSSYLNLNLLQRLLQSDGEKEKVLALSGRWGKQIYPSGALYVLSRETVDQIVSHARNWLHDYIDDVSLGILLNLSPKNVIAIPRYDFPYGSLEKSKSNDSLNSRFIHYRCKATSASETIENLKTVHKIVHNT
jgi:hypothetical protein